MRLLKGERRKEREMFKPRFLSIYYMRIGIYDMVDTVLTQKVI